MKIQIEFKNGMFTITYGKTIGKGPTIQEAIDKMTASFKEELERFFIKK